MRKIIICVCMAVMMSSCSVSHADPITLNFSLTIDSETFKDCDEHICKFLAKMYELHSDDISDLVSKYSASNKHAVSINVNITHEVSLAETCRKWIAGAYDTVRSWFTSEPPSTPPTPTQTPIPPTPTSPPKPPKPTPKRPSFNDLLNTLKKYCGNKLDRRSDMRFIVDINPASPDLSLDIMIRDLVRVYPGIESELKAHIKISDGEIEFTLPVPDTRLNISDISRDNCLRVFLEYITARSINSKDKSKIEPLMRNDSKLEKFLSTDSLERIDYVSKLNDNQYFSEGNLNFCEVFLDSPSQYIFVDMDALRSSLKEASSGEPVINGLSSFSFKNSFGNINAEKISLSLKSLHPEEAKNPRVYGKQLGIARYFFRTDRNETYLVVVPKDKIRYFIASNQPIFESSSLNYALRDHIKDDSDKITFTLWTPESELSERNCIDIFIRQLIEHVRR